MYLGVFALAALCLAGVAFAASLVESASAVWKDRVHIWERHPERWARSEADVWAPLGGPVQFRLSTLAPFDLRGPLARVRAMSAAGIHICPAPTEVVDESQSGCPQWQQHAAGCPEGYLQRLEWFRQMGKTHRQKRCPGCRLFKVWVWK